MWLIGDPVGACVFLGRTKIMQEWRLESKLSFSQPGAFPSVIRHLSVSCLFSVGISKSLILKRKEAKQFFKTRIWSSEESGIY